MVVLEQYLPTRWFCQKKSIISPRCRHFQNDKTAWRAWHQAVIGVHPAPCSLLDHEQTLNPSLIFAAHCQPLMRGQCAISPLDGSAS